MKSKIVCLVLGLTLLSGCGTLVGDRGRQVPDLNHRKCGVAGATFVANALWFLAGGFPGIIALGTDFVTGAMWYSDRECKARGY